MRLLALSRVTHFLFNSRKALLVFFHQEFLVCGCLSVMKTGVSVLQSLEEQKLKKARSALPPSTWALLSYMWWLLPPSCPVTIACCRYLCFPWSCARVPSCHYGNIFLFFFLRVDLSVPSLPTLECRLTAKSPHRTVKNITCMNQVDIFNLWGSLVFRAQVWLASESWVFESSQEWASVVSH